MKTSVTKMMMSFALMGCLIIGASDASAQGRSRSQGGSTSSRSQTAAVSRSSNTVAPAATRSTSTVSRSTSATTPQVTRSTTTTTSRATTTPQVTRTSSDRTTTTTSRSTTTPQVTRSTTGSSAVTPSTSGRTTSTTTSRSTTTPQVTRSTTGSSTRTVAPSTSGRTTSTTTTQVSKPSTSHQSTSTTINNGGTTSSRATGGASTRDNVGSKVTRSNDMGSRADTDIKGRTTSRTSPDISGDKDDKGGRPGGNGNGRHDNGGKPGNGGNHDNGGKPGRGHQVGYGGSHNHFDYANHHYRNEFSWNYSHHNWSRACPPPSRPYRPAPIVWYRPVIPVGWYPYAGAPLIDRILGMNFGMLFDLSLDYLYYNGYEIDGYADHVIYLRNVRLLNYLWDDVMLCYDSHNQLVNAQFVFLSSSYGRNHFNRIYNSLCRVYGYPFTNSDGSYSWYGGNNTGWVTLSSHHNLGHSYTTLSIGY
ncbi:MAG: hypothetical protein IKI10_02925 [Muribaculaceae bacterium]|nr:hypothetical protein [Muribaculaceae bacterium]